MRWLWGSASNPFSGHQKIEKPKMLRIEFWTSENLVKKWSKPPRDPHNRIRLEKLCPKVVSDRQNAGRMTSKRRFWHFRPIRESRALNVNFPRIGPTVRSTIAPILMAKVDLRDPPILGGHKLGGYPFAHAKIHRTNQKQLHSHPRYFWRCLSGA